MSELKKCTKCQRELPLDNFRWKNKAEGRKHSQCKDCQKAQEKKHYQESLSRRESVKLTAVGQKIANTIVVDKAKECGCLKCGEKRPYVLDFHHRDESQKVATINHMLKSASLKTIQTEIEKCDILCANCHREFHYLNLHEGISYEEYLCLDSPVGRAVG